MSLDDIPQVVLPDSGIHTFIIVTESTQRKNYFLPDVDVVQHAWLYITTFRTIVRHAHIPTRLFCPKSGGYIERDDINKQFRIFGRSTMIGPYEPEEVRLLIEPEIKKKFPEYSLFIEPPADPD